MSYGHPTRSKWGATFGRTIPEFSSSALLRAVIQTCPDVSVSLAAVIGGLNADVAVSVAGVVQVTKDVSVSLSYYNDRLPTELLRLQVTHPVILVELRLPGGTMHVANREVSIGTQRYVPRLANHSGILRTITEGTDEITLQLDDTSTRGDRFRDLFVANPPEGSGVTVWVALTDDPDVLDNLFQLFEGRIERAPSFTRAECTLDVVRTEVADDRLLGRAITLADFPDAPQEVLGSIVPLVFGTVDISPGRVINTSAVGRLAFNHFVDDDFVKLVDSTDFPSAGTIQVGEEQITYTSKDDASSELRGATRGANGTTASAHSKDVVVRELSEFVVKFHDGSVARLDTFKIKDPLGNLGDPVPGPASIDYDTGEATWSELPRIRSSGVESLFHRVHFNAVDPTNAATNPQYAARENPGYGTFNYAKVSPGANLVIQTNTEDLGQPGDIKRVWLAVVHDSAPPTAIDGLVEDNTGFVRRETWDLAQERVYQQIFDFIPLPDGGFTNAMSTSERVRDSIKVDGVDPTLATFTELTRSITGIPNGYDSTFATGVAALVAADIAAYQATETAHDTAVANATAAASAASAAAIAAGAKVTFPSKSPSSFQLVAQDLTPVEIARFDDRTNDRLYDVEVQIEEQEPETKIIVPEVEIEFAGIWSNAPKVENHLVLQERENAESIFDLENDNTGDAAFNIPGEVNSGDGPGFAARAKFKEYEEDEESGFKFKSAYIRVFVDTVTALGYVYAPMYAYLEGPEGKIAESAVRCRHFNVAPGETEPTIAAGCLIAPKEFRSDVLPHGTGDSIPEEVFGSRLQHLRKLRIVLEPSAPGNYTNDPVTCLNTWVCMTCDLVIELEKEPPPDPVIEDRAGITNHFEVTSLVDGDWSFFSDAARGGSITVESAAGELRVLEAFWVVEYAPYFDASSSVPEVFATVAGFAQDGNPADIAEAIVTNTAPQGMGLDESVISRPDYYPAQVGFTADGVRADFTLDEPVTALELLARLADECDFRQAWDRGKHRIVRKPSLGGILTVNGSVQSFAGGGLEVYRTVLRDEVLRDSLRFSRTALADVLTRYAVSYRPLAYTSKPGGSIDMVNDLAEITFGRRETVRDLQLIRDENAARLVTARDLLRRAEPRWLVEVLLPLSALEFVLGDLVALTHIDFSFGVGEVLDASLETVILENGPFLAVQLSLIVWEK